MKAPLTIKDLVNLLYQNRVVIEMLFGNKDSINKSEILARDDMSDEKLEKLVTYEIIHENNNIIGLDDRITTFIEEFLEIGEVTTSFITDNIRSLNENLKYYHIDSNPKFLRNIKRSLKKINSTTSREVMKLHKNIDETYKNQDNYIIKLQELDKYKRKRDDIINLIKESEQIISEAQGFFNTIVDAELNSIVLDLRYVLVRNRDYLNEIQAQIIDYINKIQYQSAIYKKIQRLKELKDYEELKYKTNFVDVVIGTRALMFQKRNPLKSKLSLDFLHTDQGYAITQKVAGKLHLLRNLHRKPAGKMAAGFDDNSKEESASLNIAGLVEKFMQSDTDLFQFVLNYKFPDKVGALSLEKRISLYVGISIDYDNKLLITGKIAKMDYVNEKKQKLRLGYAIIKPNKKALQGNQLQVASSQLPVGEVLVSEGPVMEEVQVETKNEKKKVTGKKVAEEELPVASDQLPGNQLQVASSQLPVGEVLVSEVPVMEEVQVEKKNEKKKVNGKKVTEEELPVASNRLPVKTESLVEVKKPPEKKNGKKKVNGEKSEKEKTPKKMNGKLPEVEAQSGRKRKGKSPAEQKVK